MDLKNRVVIITGAGRGIGKAIAIKMVTSGAFVVLAARTTAEIEKLSAEIGEDRSFAFPCDVTDAASCKALIVAAVERFGKIDVLINNAGTVHASKKFVELEEDAWEEMFQVNLMGAVRLTRLAARYFIKQGRPGSIVNITSVAGMQAALWQSAYGASKAALISLTQSAAAELGKHGIRVNAIACGLVRTRLADPIFSNPALLEKFLKKTPLGRAAQPLDIANVAAFLASDNASFITGHTVVADGGISL